MAKIGASVKSNLYSGYVAHSTSRIPRAASAEFVVNIDAAMGVEPEAAWPIIAELYDSHGWSAWYDLGVICVSVMGVGYMYLSVISSNS